MFSSDVFAQIYSRSNPSHSRTGIHDASARVAAISTVDKEINAKRQSLCVLLTRHNTLVPISLLPPEILARVFHLLVLKKPPFSGGRKLGWIRVTHVCRHWRQVALDHSSLWARIPGNLAYKEWISEMLARAKNAPLDIEFRFATMSSRKALTMITPHISRTRRLCFHGLSEGGFDSVRKICWKAPALEHFELTAPYYTPIRSGFSVFGRNMLFNGHAPRLRAFSLSRVVIPWPCIPRGQLTQLKIISDDEEYDYPGDLNQMIDFLVNCPQLEILTLESCLPSQLTEFTHGRAIHLPRLSRLRLCGSTSRILNMLKMLKLPSSTTLHLNCISNTTDYDPERLLLPVISAQLQSSAPVEFKSLTVTHLGESLDIIASTFPPTLRNRPAQISEDDIIDDAELVLSFDELCKLGHSTDLLQQACKMLPISNVEFISMSVSEIFDIDWVELLSCCTNVNTMQAIGPGTSSIVRALTALTVTNAGSSKEGRKRRRDNRESTVVQPASTVAHAHAAIFPKLKFLGLRDLDFAAPGNLFDVVERGLQQRMVMSGALLKILISDCSISTKRANALRKLVQDFHWDDNQEPLYDSYTLSQELVFVDSGFELRDWNPENGSTDTDDYDEDDE